MPLFSEHISNMYYSGTPSYSAPSYSYSAPSGTSYSASYLNPGSLYSKHSSLGGYSRAPITPRWTPSSARSYNPMLTTISERSTSSPVRIGSPRRVHIPKRTYALSSYTPRPININTADIDVSRDRYRTSPPTTYSPAARTENSVVNAPSQNDGPKVPIDTPIVDNGPFMPRVDGKPETGIDSSPGAHQRSTIKRGRTVVRLHTVKRKERDSPRKPVDEKEQHKQTADASDEAQESETAQGWREKLSEDLVYKDKREKKTLGAKLVEKFILKDKEDDEDIASTRKDLLKNKDNEIENIFENTSTMNVIVTSKSPDRRCSMEMLAEQANVLDSLIRGENLSLATLDLTKIGIEDDTKRQQPKQLSVKRRKSSNEINPLQTTQSDHSIHDRMKSLRDSKEKNYSKKRSLKKSASGGSLRRLASITEFPKELPLMNLPAIEETRHSIKYRSIKDKPKRVCEETLNPETMQENIEEVKDKTKSMPDEVTHPTNSKPSENANSTIEDVIDQPQDIVAQNKISRSVNKDETKEKSKPPNLDQPQDIVAENKILRSVNKEKSKPSNLKVTSTVDISPPKSPLKFIVDNVIVEETLTDPNKIFSYSRNIDDMPKKNKLESVSKSEKIQENSRLKPESVDSETEAPSPEPDDGNFWSKIGKRETVYLMKRKQNIEENLAKNRRALYWFAEDEEQQQDNLTKAAADIEVNETEAQVKIEKAEETAVDVNMLNQTALGVKETKPKMEFNVGPNVEIHQIIENVEITLKGPGNVQVMPADKIAKDNAKIIAPVSVIKNQPPPYKSNDKEDSPNISPKLNESHQSSLNENKSLNKDDANVLEKSISEVYKSATVQDLKNNVAGDDKVTSNSEMGKHTLFKPVDKQIPSETNLKSPENILNDKTGEKNETGDKNKCANTSSLAKIDDHTKPQLAEVAKPEVKPKSKKKVLKKTDKSPPGTCTECKKPLPKSTPPKQTPVPKPECKDVVRKASASIKTKDLDVRRFTDEKPIQITEVHSIPIVEQSEKENIPKIQIEVTTETTVPTQKAPAGEGNKAELVPASKGDAQVLTNPITPKVTPKKPVKVEAAIRPLIATPRPLQKKAPQVIQSSSSSESSSSEESSDEDESGTSEGSGEFFECENNPDGRTSTGSNDSGFDSSAPTSPAGFVHIKKDCDVNCHRKCEKLTANLCGVNQRLLVEALASKSASRRGGETPGTSSSAATKAETAPEVLLDELGEKSSSQKAAEY